MEEASLQQAGASAQPSIVAPAVPSDAPLPSTSRQQRIDDDQDDGTPQDQQSSSSYKASEIATRFIEVIDPNKSPHVDAAAPIDSVKGAVNKFGGILDWREKRKQPQDDPDKVQEEAREFHKRSQAAEAGRAQSLHDLETTAGAADKLRLSLKKAQIEEAQVRQEAELAERHLRETQRGASERAAAEAELGAVRDRRAAALADLQAARAEVLSLEKVRAAAAAEADAVVAQAREATAESRETGKAVEELAAELVALKGELESSHAAHVEAEEKRLRLALALKEDKSRWQMELEEAQQEAKRLRDELMAACDVEMKAEASSELMANLKAELFACTVVLQADGTLGDKPTVTLDKVRKELEDVKASVDQAKDEAKYLRLAAASMRDDLDKEKAELAALRRREGLSSASIPYLREELSRVTFDLAAAEAAAKADSNHDESKMAEQVGDARREAEEAKAKVRSAREEIAKAREETGVARAAVTTMEARLEAVTREILAATTSEEIATDSAAALLQEISIKPSRKAAVVGGVTLTVEEYDELSRRARETEEIAGKRVIEAVKLIKEAKDAEVRSLEKLAKVDRQTEQRRQALEAATLEAEEAEFQKLSAERELRQYHADHDPQRRRAAGEAGSSPRTGLAEISVLHDHPGGAGDGRGNPHILSPRGGYMPRTESMAPAEAEARGQRKTTTFFPRMVMFLARKRAQSWK